jgi:hypothetical protein
MVLEKISWTTCVKSEVLHRVKKVRNIIHTVKRRKLTGLVTAFVGTVF